MDDYLSSDFIKPNECDQYKLHQYSIWAYRHLLLSMFPCYRLTTVICQSIQLCVFTLIWERAASTVYIIISLGRFLYLGFLSTFLRYQIFTRGVYICKHKGFSFIFHRNFFSLFFHVPPSTRPFIHFIPKIKTNQRSMLRLIHCIAIDRWPGEYKIYRHDWNFDGVY